MHRTPFARRALAIAPFLLAFTFAAPALATVVTIPASKDNTLYESATGDVSNGAGDTKTPTRLNILCFWIFQIPFAYFLAKGLHLNALGAILSLPASQALFALIAWLYFKKGNWKSVKV